MSKRYPIRTMGDFNAIPVDKLAAFEFDVCALVRSICEARRIGAVVTDRPIEWIDDDHALTVHVSDTDGNCIETFEVERYA